MDLQDVVIASEESVISVERTPQAGSANCVDATEQDTAENVGAPVAKPDGVIVSIDDDDPKDCAAQMFSLDDETMCMETENTEHGVAVAENNHEASGDETSGKTSSDDVIMETTSPDNSTMIQSHWNEPDASIKLLGLPIDALHCIASFLTASDWACFGLTNTVATPICRDVFQRVRMHGFRCATEVATAWVSGRCRRCGT